MGVGDIKSLGGFRESIQHHDWIFYNLSSEKRMESLVHAR